MSALPVVLLGAGGHAHVVLDVIELSVYALAGVSAPELVRGSRWLGVEVLGGDEDVLRLGCETVLLVNGIGVIPGQSVRARVHRHFVGRGYRFISLIHPSAVIAAQVAMDEGVQVMAGVIIQPGCRLATGVIVNTGARIDHDCEIGEHAFIGPGATVCGDVRIEAGAFIGAGAVVLPGVTVKKDAVVGAGAVVVRTVETGVTVVGNPAVRVSRS
ncbi:NeuD/PglB/VioB family sugar acetyltransferase [Pseudomonas sp.]|uniref:NeuD/PglB/VioB family sugar acetyltransferase n=1 Tax=Pseudomonas sp. TaxID=306 RepID=UPI003A97B678